MGRIAPKRTQFELRAEYAPAECPALPGWLLVKLLIVSHLKQPALTSRLFNEGLGYRQLPSRRESQRKEWPGIWDV